MEVTNTSNRFIDKQLLNTNSSILIQIIKQESTTVLNCLYRFVDLALSLITIKATYFLFFNLLFTIVLVYLNAGLLIFKSYTILLINYCLV